MVRAVDDAVGTEAAEALRTARSRRCASQFTASPGQKTTRNGQTASGVGTVRRRLGRPQRVWLLLLAVWIVSIFDLGFTLHQARSLNFRELNPVAARLLHAPPLVLFAYKFALLGASTIILIWVRRHAVAELACWLLLATLFYVAVRWFVYYEQLLKLPRDWVEHSLP